MVDPSDALPSFQEALTRGVIHLLQQGKLNDKLYVHTDNPRGTPRFVYMLVDHKVITALVIIAVADPIDAVPCLQIGYAVPENLRRKGLGTTAVAAAIAELANGFAGHPAFYLEAVVADDNEASKRVAAATLGPKSTPITDSISGVSARRYLRLVRPPKSRA